MIWFCLFDSLTITEKTLTESKREKRAREREKNTSRLKSCSRDLNVKKRKNFIPLCLCKTVEHSKLKILSRKNNDSDSRIERSDEEENTLKLVIECTFVAAFRFMAMRLLMHGIKFFSLLSLDLGIWVWVGQQYRNGEITERALNWSSIIQQHTKNELKLSNWYWITIEHDWNMCVCELSQSIYGEFGPEFLNPWTPNAKRRTNVIVIHYECSQSVQKICSGLNIQTFVFCCC